MTWIIGASPREGSHYARYRAHDPGARSEVKGELAPESRFEASERKTGPLTATLVNSTSDVVEKAAPSGRAVFAVGRQVYVACSGDGRPRQLGGRGAHERAGASTLSARGSEAAGVPARGRARGPTRSTGTRARDRGTARRCCRSRSAPRGGRGTRPGRNGDHHRRPGARLAAARRRICRGPKTPPGRGWRRRASPTPWRCA